MRTFYEFQHHIDLHRNRVIKLGMALAIHKFPNIEKSLLKKFLELHDFSKTVSSHQVLSHFDYQHRDLPVQRLYGFYGKKPATESQMQKLVDVINDVNFIDKKVSEEFFNQHTHLSWRIQEDIFTIEKVSDLVDRSLDPLAAEEFGHPMLLASDYLDDEHLVNLSLWLERHYHNITKGLSFSSVS